MNPQDNKIAEVSQSLNILEDNISDMLKIMKEKRENKDLEFAKKYKESNNIIKLAVFKLKKLNLSTKLDSLLDKLAFNFGKISGLFYKNPKTCISFLIFCLNILIKISHLLAYLTKNQVKFIEKNPFVVKKVKLALKDFKPFVVRSINRFLDIYNDPPERFLKYWMEYDAFIKVNYGEIENYFNIFSNPELKLKLLENLGFQGNQILFLKNVEFYKKTFHKYFEIAIDRSKVFSRNGEAFNPPIEYRMGNINRYKADIKNILRCYEALIKNFGI